MQRPEQENSRQEAKATQRPQHHVVDWLLGGELHETKAMTVGGTLDVMSPLRERSQVRSLRHGRRRELTLNPSLGVLEPGVAGPVGCDLLRSQQLQDCAFLAGAAESR